MEDIFEYAPTIDFSREKLAEIDLGEDQALWYRKILTELYRTLPEASQYAPEVQMLQTDDEQGFALGVVSLDGSTDSAIADKSASKAKKTINTVYIPVIVKHHVMMPLDVMLVGNKVLPLNAPRLREALFRPMGMDLMTEDWGDTSLLAMFNMPGRSDIYPNSGMGGNMGGGDVQTLFGSGMKTGSYELLQEIASTVLSADRAKLASVLSAPELQYALAHNPVYLGAVRVLSEADDQPEVEEMFKAAADAGPVDVVQLGYSELLGSYWVKAASRGSYAPVRTLMGRGEFIKFAGPEATQKVDTEGTVTIAEPSEERAEKPKKEGAWAPISKAGVYSVKTPSGEELTGWVLPELLDFDGSKASLSVFTNGAKAAVQGQILGTKARGTAASELSSTKPKGTGLFYVGGEGGSILASVPVEVLGSTRSTEGDVGYKVTTLTGAETTVHVLPSTLFRGMKTLGGELFVGENVKFLPLDKETQVQLISEPGDVTKTAAYLAEPSIRILTTDRVCTLDFDGLPKLASRVSAGPISMDEAVLVLCLAGLGATEAVSKVAEATDRTVTLRGVKDIVTLEDHADELRDKTAAASRQILSLRHDLTKEAAVLPDVQTVDTVLSLGLMNSENIRAYVAKLPYLEKTLDMLGHLLIASRLGLSEVPEGAAARCIRGLDEVCRGLTALGLRDLSEGEM